MKFLLLIFSIFFVSIGATMSIYLKEESLDILPKLQVINSPEEIFFSCGDDKKFISHELICDGREDCANGFDEENCELD
jgi:Low-density lipoprotein receptor domain class A